MENQNNVTPATEEPINIDLIDFGGDFELPNHTDPNKKPWYKSKTIWFNLATGVVTGVASTLPELQQHVSPLVFLGVNAVVNIALRLVTNKGVH